MDDLKTTDETAAARTDLGSALERIASALEDIAFHLSDAGSIGEQLSQIWERLDEITPEAITGHRFLRTLDIGRD